MEIVVCWTLVSLIECDNRYQRRHADFMNRTGFYWASARNSELSLDHSACTMLATPYLRFSTTTKIESQYCTWICDSSMAVGFTSLSCCADWESVQMGQTDKLDTIRAFLKTLPLDNLLWIFLVFSLVIQLCIARILLWIGAPVWLVWTVGLYIFFGLRVILLKNALKVKEKHGSPYPAHLKRNALQRAGVLLQEFLVFISLYAFIQPLDRLVMPLLERVGQKSGLQNSNKTYPVILIHGFFCNSMFWFPTQLYLGSAGFKDIYTISLFPSLGDIREFSKQLSNKVCIP